MWVMSVSCTNVYMICISMAMYSPVSFQLFIPLHKSLYNARFAVARVF